MALFTTFTGYCQENETGISEDSLRELALQYYSDIRHWDIFVEPSIIVKQDVDFDRAGLKHAYFVNRYYYFAVPQKADFRYQPRKIGPFLYAYGQKMPVEGEDASYFQTFRAAVFPLAANNSIEVSSEKIFQQFADQNLESDIRVMRNKIQSYIEHLSSIFSLEDTAPQKKENTAMEEDHHRETNTLSCLTEEYNMAIPHPQIIAAPPREPLTSPKNIELLKKNARMNKNGIYLVPSNSILNAIAESADCFCETEDNIAEMLLLDESGDEQSCNAISGNYYHLLGPNAIIIHHEEYSVFQIKYCREIYSNEDYTYDTVLVFTPKGIKKTTLADCYSNCLKGDKNVSCPPSFPPVIVIDIYVDSEKTWEDIQNKDAKYYPKDGVLHWLKKGSVLYDFFEKGYDRDFDNGYYEGFRFNIDWYDDDDIPQDITK